MNLSLKKILSVIFVRIIPVLLLVYFFVYTIFYVTSIHGKIREWNAVAEDIRDSVAYTAEEWELIRLKTFLDARLAMSASDSIGLTINIKDSTVQLEMKGVVLRQVVFDRVEMSRFFRSFHPVAYAHHFSKPFTIGEIEGSIVKEPVTVRKVPKDTIEAAQTRIEIDSLGVEFVEWHLILGGAVMVSIVQSDQFDARLPMSTLMYRIRRHLKTLNETNRDVLRLRKPVLYPEITIFIPANEAKSFYRALPPKGQVALKL
jgi:hypothetical protein